VRPVWFTLDRDYRLQVAPALETDSEILQQTLVEQRGERVTMADGGVSGAYLDRHNSTLE
jgi:hypothetical protein